MTDVHSLTPLEIDEVFKALRIASEQERRKFGRPITADREPPVPGTILVFPATGSTSAAQAPRSL